MLELPVGALKNATLNVSGNLLGSKTDNGTARETLHAFSPAELAVWFSLYGIIALLSVTGNSIVIIIILRRPKMQTVVNLLIFNLAVADALTGLLAIPFKFQAALLQRWLLPRFMCKLVPFIESVTLSVSVSTLTVIASDRLRSIICPNGAKLNRRAARFIIMSIWVICAAYSLPYGLFHEAVPPPVPGLNATFLVCLPLHRTTSWWNWYNICLTIITYFVPLFIVNSAYGFIAYKVWLTQPLEISLHEEVRNFNDSKRKVIKMLVMVVTVFTFCWLPYETYLVLSEIRPRINSYHYINVIFFCSHWLAMSNSCLNPIIYGIYNEKFQREYRCIFLRLIGRGGQDIPQTHTFGLSTIPRSESPLNMGNSSPSPDFRGEKNALHSENPNNVESALRRNTATLSLSHKHAIRYQYIAAELGKDEDD